MASQVTPIPEKTPTPEPPKLSRRLFPVPSLEQIRARAYQKYCARDGAPSDALHDWLESEYELRNPERDPAEHRSREIKLLSAAEPNADPFC